MGAALVKNCFMGETPVLPSDATPRRGLPNLTPRPPALGRMGHVLPHKMTPHSHALDNYYAKTHRSSRGNGTREIVPQTRKLTPYEKHRIELQQRSPAFIPMRRERWDSRESTCSSSSSMEEDPRAMFIPGMDLYEKEYLRRRGRKSPVPRSWAPTEDSFCRSSISSSHSVRSSIGTPASSRRLSRVSSPFGFEELLPECYVLEDLIGHGTTSKCYRCRRTTDGRLFACKIINKRRLSFDIHNRDETFQQLRQEIDVLHRLDHPHIAKLEDSFENDTYIILMMELLEGGELFDTIIDRVHLTEADAKHVARGVLEAISYMHSMGIVHRDIKPENLLLATHATPGKPLHVKIVDFGFASSVQRPMTSFLGTGGYLAPEVILHRPYTSAVDVWSYGVLLYLMLSGRLPFPTTIHLQPGQRISSLYRLTFPEKYWRGVSSSARDLLKQLLVLNPATRLSAADALEHAWFQQ